MTLENLGYAERIRIGDPGRTISGRHRYKVAYPLDNVAPEGRLAWDAVGTQWPVGVGNVEGRVLSGDPSARRLKGSLALLNGVPGHQLPYMQIATLALAALPIGLAMSPSGRFDLRATGIVNGAQPVVQPSGALVVTFASFFGGSASGVLNQFQTEIGIPPAADPT